jgi:hypothetical protein
VSLRELFVKRISCSRPSRVCNAFLSRACSSWTSKERKGATPAPLLLVMGGACGHAWIQREHRECIVNERIGLLNAREEHMREACYRSCGDWELRLRASRKEERA